MGSKGFHDFDALAVKLTEFPAPTVQPLGSVARARRTRGQGRQVQILSPRPVKWLKPLGYGLKAFLVARAGARVVVASRGIQGNTETVERIRQEGARPSLVSQAGAEPEPESPSFAATVEEPKKERTPRLDQAGLSSTRTTSVAPLSVLCSNNAHVHKEDPSKNQLDDLGKVTTNPDKSHIGIRNPKDLPAVRGRPHGDGSK